MQNPSIVLAFIAVTLRPFLKYTLIVDAHNSGVFPSKKLQSISNFINKNANFVIVTNQGLASFVESIGGNPIILPDPLPRIEVDPKTSSVFSANSVNPLSVMVICSWSSDEPYVEIIASAEKLPDIKFYITGSSKGRELNYSKPMPSNVFLTGYLSTNDYHALLISSAVVLDLTTREDCLVCGAYEAISVGKPLVLSDTQALRSYFGEEAIFVKNEVGSIVQGILEVFASYEKFSEKSKSNSQKIESRWLLLFEHFKRVIFSGKNQYKENLQ